MTHHQALQKAHELGITNISHTSTKSQIIRAIQNFQGSEGCFAKPSRGYCENTQCKWREDCMDHLSIHR